MKQKLKKYLYVFSLWGIKGALLLCMSCKKEEPCQCLDCGAPEQKMTFHKNIENADADSWGNGMVIVYQNVRYATSFCYQQLDTYQDKLKVTYIEGKPQPFKYRVWGTVYNCDSCPTYIKGSVLYFKITKIEYQN